MPPSSGKARLSGSRQSGGEGETSFLRIDLLGPYALHLGGMRRAATYGIRGLSAAHGIHEPRGTGDALAFTRPFDGVAKSGGWRRAVGLPSMGVRGDDSTPDEVGSNRLREREGQRDGVLGLPF
jgi:hypothetical protein